MNKQLLVSHNLNDNNKRVRTRHPNKTNGIQEPLLLLIKTKSCHMIKALKQLSLIQTDKRKK